MQTKKTTEASTTPPNDDLPCLERRYHAHSPAAGRNESREVLFRATIPHNRPNSSHGSRPSRSSIVSASQKMEASSKAERLVSHTARVHQNMTFGSKAQDQADQTPTCSENIRRPIRKIGMHVSAENTLFSASSTNADALE